MSKNYNYPVGCAYISTSEFSLELESRKNDFELDFDKIYELSKETIKKEFGDEVLLIPGNYYKFLRIEVFDKKDTVSNTKARKCIQEIIKKIKEG